MVSSALARRAGKLSDWLRWEPRVGVRLSPFPWRTPGSPYYVENPPSDPDGHGGYTSIYAFDAQGVPWLRGVPDAVRYDPLVVARYARRMLAVAHATGSPRAAARAGAMLAPLVISGRASATWARGATPWTMRGPPHANVQGELVSVMLRLCGGRPDREITELVGRAIDVMLAAEHAGGTRSTLGLGPFLEEYPCTPIRHVLGGCITGLFGLYDAAEVLRHSRAAEAAEVIERNVARQLHRFMLPNGWSLYALQVHGLPYLASARYQESRLFKLRVLEARAPGLALGPALAGWETALRGPGTRMASAAIKTAQVLWVRYVRGRKLREA